MAKIFVEMRKDAVYLEEQALADANFPWEDYSACPPVVLSNGKKLLSLIFLVDHIEHWELTVSLPQAQIDHILDQLHVMAEFLEFDNGNSSGIVDLPQETIDQIKLVLEPYGWATFTEITP